MIDTPRTDAAEIVQIFVNHPELRTNRVPTEFARQLERELAAAKDGWRDEICKAQTDMRRAETMLNDERKHCAESQSDFRCLAELLGGHDATECRANLVKLKADLAAERALADRLAEQVRELRYYDGKSPSANKRSDEALAEWKEARRE